MAYRNTELYEHCEENHSESHCKYCRFDGICDTQGHLDENERLYRLRRDKNA